MQKQSMALIISFVIGIISSIVATLIIPKIWILIPIVIGTFLGFIVVLFYKRTEEINKSIDKIYNSPCPQTPICCGLFEAGFCKVSEDKDKPFGTNLENVSKSYKFLGVSAEFLLQEKNFWKIVQQKTLQEEDCYFQIILLDPDAKELVERHRKTEGFYQSTEALSHRLKTSITEIASFVKECDGKLQIRLYRELPIFRLVIVDDLYAFINFYGAKNLTGVQTPQIAFLKTEKSYFIAFKKYYDQIFAESTQYNI